MEESPACSSSSEELMAPAQRSTPSHSKQICRKCECDETPTFTSRRQSTVLFILLGIIFLLPSTQSASFGGNDFDIFRYKCPDRCICVPDVVDTNQLIITCQLDYLSGGKTFEEFPLNATKSLTLRCLSDQNESTFSDDMFEGFRSLKDLRIANCHGTDLPTNTFRGLTSLKSLHLSKLATKNQPGLSHGLFQPITALEKLTLTESAIRDLPDGLFCPLLKLQILNLTANRLSSTKVNTEANNCELAQLIILDISSNLIETISEDDLSAFPNLRQLSATDNDIIEIHQEAFAKVPTLQHLDLEDNELTEMVPLPEGLLHLNLARNRLSVIPAAIANLNKLISVNLSINSIDANTPFSLLSESLESVDLSNNKLDSIPIKIIQQSLNSLLYLYLSGNQVAVLQPNQLQNLTRLQKLDLSNNQIKTLNDDCFTGLTELVELSVRNNSIYHVDVGVFPDVSRRLQRLDFSSNLLVELPMAISRLTRMKSMDFSQNQISKLYKFVLNKMTHLSRVDLSNNKIPAVESFVFSDCTHLTEINLSNNRIDSLAQDSFEKCPHLRTIDLSRNKISAFSGSIMGLKGLRHLNVSGNNLDTLEWTEFPDELLDLDASKNKITIIAPATKSQVKKVDLKSNRISHIAKNQLCGQIEQIDLSSNQIISIENDAFIPLTGLKVVNLQNNRLKSVAKRAFRDPESSLLNGLLTTHLYLDGNPLVCDCEMSWMASLSTKTSIQLLDSQTTRCRNQVTNELVKIAEVKENEYLCSYDQACEPQCICCQYGNCDCKSKCPEGCSCFHDSDFKTNVVQCKGLNETNQLLFNPKVLPMHATHIFLENLNLPTLKTHDFMSRARLTELRINGSNIKTIQPLAFNTLPSLKKLDLSGNFLTELKGDELFKTMRIEHLNLHSNQLYEIDNRLLQQLPALETIRLDGNSFDELPEMLTLDSRISKVSISGNPFRCDCDWKRFQVQHWVLSNAEKIIDAKKLECVENVTASFISNDTTVLTGFAPNRGEHLYTMPMSEFLLQANSSICVIEVEGIFGRETRKNLVLVIFSIFFAFAAVCGLIYIVMTLIKRNKNGKNRYMKATPSLNCSTATPGSSPLPLPLIQYDAFISYSKRDEEMVLNQICRRLEEEDYSLCLLHQGGARLAYHAAVHNISDELIHQMEACNALIIVLTNNFLENEWETLQIKIAHRFFAKKRNKRIITILGDEIRPNELDAELGKILRSNTRVKKNDQLFWNLLMNAMPLKTNTQHSSGSTVLGDGSDIYSEMYGSVVPSEIV